MKEKATKAVWRAPKVIQIKAGTQLHSGDMKGGAEGAAMTHVLNHAAVELGGALQRQTSSSTIVNIYAGKAIPAHNDGPHTHYQCGGTVCS